MDIQQYLQQLEKELKRAKLDLDFKIIEGSMGEEKVPANVSGLLDYSCKITDYHHTTLLTLIEILKTTEHDKKELMKMNVDLLQENMRLREGLCD